MRLERHFLLAAGMAVLTAATLAAPAPAAPDTALYAAPNGWGGTCAKFRPCSLEQAVDRLHSGSVLYLRGGTYRLTKTIELNQSNVSIRAYPEEKPVLTGAQRVTGFTLSDPSKNIYVTRVPRGTDTRQLFVDGARAERARTALNSATFTATATGFTTPDPSLAKVTNQSDVEVVQENKWKHMRCPLTAITADSAGSNLTVQPDCWQDNNVSVINSQFPFNGNGLPKLDGVSWLENAYQFLTKPGQWYLDRNAGKLYYIPLPGQNANRADVELPLLDTLVSASGTPGHIVPVDDSVGTYKGAWQNSTGRQLGDFQDGVHATQTSGAAVSYTFTGTGLDVLGETNADGGAFTVSLDGKRDPAAHSEHGDVRLAQQVVYSVQNLKPGRHTVTLTNGSGNLLVDAFAVTPQAVKPVHDISIAGLTFTGTTWTLPSHVGYIDNQAGVQWAVQAPHAPIRPPAALQFHRGKNITVAGDTFTHLGGVGVAFADGTQNSSITRNVITDTSAGGVAVGEVDDYYLTDPSRMTEHHHRRQHDHLGRPGLPRRRRHLGRARPAHCHRPQRDRPHAVLRDLARLGLGLGLAVRPPGQARPGRLPPRHHLLRRQSHHRQQHPRRHADPARRRADLHPRRPGRERREHCRRQLAARRPEQQQHAVPRRRQLVLGHARQRGQQPDRPLGRHVDADHPRHHDPRQLHRQHRGEEPRHQRHHHQHHGRHRRQLAGRRAGDHGGGRAATLIIS